MLSTRGLVYDRPLFRVIRRRQCVTARRSHDSVASDWNRKSRLSVLRIVMCSSVGIALALLSDGCDDGDARTDEGRGKTTLPVEHLPAVFVVPGYGPHLRTVQPSGIRTGIEGVTEVQYVLQGAGPPETFLSAVHGSLVRQKWAELQYCLRSPTEPCGKGAGWRRQGTNSYWEEWWRRGNEAMCVAIYCEAAPSAPKAFGVFANLTHYAPKAANALIKDYEVHHPLSTLAEVKPGAAGGNEVQKEP